MSLAKKSLWIDAEWYMHGRIFLIGYAYSEKQFGQLFGKKLTKLRFRQLLKKVKGFVFSYGPDVGMCEKFFNWKFRGKYRCVNLMKAFRDHVKSASFKLKDLEIKFRLRRKVDKYKQSIMHIWRDWKDPVKRYAVLTYNEEDVVNLVKLTKIIFKKHKIKAEYLNAIALK